MLPVDGRARRRAIGSTLCVVLLTSSMGCLMDFGDDTYNPRIFLQMGSIDPILDNATYHWNAKLEITRVVLDWDRNILWDDIVFRLDWEVLPIYMWSRWYNGTPPTEPGPHLLINDMEKRWDTPDAGDSLGLFGMSRQHQGNELSLALSSGELLTRIRLPLVWNETFTVELGTPLVALEAKGNWSWSVEVQVLRHAPAWERVPWDDVDVGTLWYNFLESPSEDLKEQLPSLKTVGVNWIDHKKITVDSDDEFITAGDVVQVHNLRQNPGHPIMYAGNDLVVLTGDVLLGYSGLPEDFPDPLGQ